MLDRDERILKHIGLYRVSIRAAIERRFFDGKSCDHVLSRLVRSGRLQPPKDLPGGLSYYQLSLSEVERRRPEIPQNRARPHTERALREALSVLWFCCMSPVRRERLQRQAIAAHFGRGTGRGCPHVAESRSDTDKRVYRLYLPGPRSGDRYRLKVVQREAELAAEDPRLAPWIAAKKFAFAIVVSSPARQARMKARLGRLPPLPVPVVVEFVPDLDRLADAIRAMSPPRPQPELASTTE